MRHFVPGTELRFHDLNSCSKHCADEVQTLLVFDIKRVITRISLLVVLKFLFFSFLIAFTNFTNRNESETSAFVLRIDSRPDYAKQRF